jgi:lysophospholipase L1-like esterase
MRPFDDFESKHCLAGLFLNLGNSFWRYMRHRRFYRWSEDARDKKCIVAEGDSWFLHPLKKDIIDHLSKEYPVCSLAAGGDDLLEYYLTSEYLSAVKKFHPKVVLLSGGGNDLLAGRFKHFLVDWHEDIHGQGPKRFLNSMFFERLDDVILHYGRMIDNINQVHGESKPPQILLHSYGYGPAGRFPGIWLGRYMRERGIVTPEDRAGIIKVIIDEFYVRLDDLASNHSNVGVMDFRKLLQKKSAKGRLELWSDEIHPNRQGFKLIAKRYKDKIDDLLNQDAAGASAQSRRGLVIQMK